MTLSLHTLAVGTFVPMLESLSSCLDKGAAHATATELDLVNARLAPDMYTLAQQVQQACHHVRDGVARLAGGPPVEMDTTAAATLAGITTRITETIAIVCGVPVSAFDGADDRDCSIPIPGDLVIEMDGARFLIAWVLPHFYFHIVTAYDILRHHGVVIGKQDYVSQVGGFIRPRT